MNPKVKLRAKAHPPGKVVKTVGSLTKWFGDDQVKVPDVPTAYAIEDNGDGTFDVLVDEPK